MFAVNDAANAGQVEGLADLLHADTMEQKEQALKQMDGRTTAVYAKWRTELVSCLAHLEAVVDFAEDEDDVGEKHILSEGATTTRVGVEIS